MAVVHVPPLKRSVLEPGETVGQLDLVLVEDIDGEYGVRTFQQGKRVCSWSMATMTSGGSGETEAKAETVSP